MKAIKISILSLCLILGLSTCKKKCCDPNNPDCENYDPCYGKKPNANFLIKEYDGWFDENILEPEFCDTISNIGATFLAQTNNAKSYEWTIGTDNRKFYGKQIDLLFTKWRADLNNLNPLDPQYYKPINITLTIRNNPSSCIADIDTLIIFTKQLVFTRFLKQRFKGVYKGYFNKEKIEKVVTIDDTFSIKYARSRMRIINFPNMLNQDTLLFANGSFGSFGVRINSYKQYWWEYDIGKYQEGNGIDGLDYYMGFAKFITYMNKLPDGRDYITIKYKSYNKQNEARNYSFRGVKIK